MKQLWRRITWSGTFLFCWPWLAQAAAAQLTHGVTSGEVTATSANIWARAGQATALLVEYATSPDFQQAKAGGRMSVAAQDDFTGVVKLTGLRPATRHYYRLRSQEAQEL